MDFKPLVVAICALALFSCRKDSDAGQVATPNVAPQAGIADFAPLDSGNYWIYERMNVDSNGVVISGPWVDSVWVHGDTILWDGLHYTALYRALNSDPLQISPKYWRIENNTMWEPAGGFLFQTGTYDQPLYTDTIGTNVSLTYSVLSQTETFDTQQDQLTCYRVKADLAVFGGVYPPVPEERQPYYLWSANVGRVFSQEPFMSSGAVQRIALLRYHVQ